MDSSSHIPTKKTIFIVDDSPWHNILLKRILAKYQYKVYSFADGYALLKELTKQKPDLIISDINMPRLDGIKLLREIRKSPSAREIPVIFISSMQKEKIKRNIEPTSATGFLQKPVTIKKLITLIEDTLS